MAEAKLLNKPFEDVWDAETSKDDRKGVYHAGFLCGMTVDEITEEIRHYSAARALGLFNEIGDVCCERCASSVLQTQGDIAKKATEIVRAALDGSINSGRMFDLIQVLGLGATFLAFTRHGL
jgi:hypothetical protein